MRNFVKKINVFGLVVMGFLGTNVQAAIEVYTDRATFDAAIAGAAATTTDDFGTDIAAADSINFSSGVVSMNSPGRGTTDNSVSGGAYSNRVSFNNSTGSTQIDWIFPDPVFAIGFDYVTDRGSSGVRVQMDDGSGLIAPALSFLGSSSQLVGFAGFITTGSFLQFAFIEASSGGSDLSVDDLTFAAAPVPLPAAWPLFLIGLASVRLIGRRR